MAGSVDQDMARVVVKKEIEDTPESPEHTDVQDSPSNQADTNGSQRQTKVWSEDETRSMIELHKSYVQRFKDGNYSKKQLLDDVAQELNLIGYDTTPEKVRNKMKCLKARYKRVVDYNAKHVEKKIMPFQDELTELYSMECFDDQEPLLNGNGSSDNTFCSKSERIMRKPKPIPAPHVDLKTVVAKKKNTIVSKALKTRKIIKKKVKAKRAAQPLYQCGLCMNKFRSSSDMHGHICKTPIKVNNNKKKPSSKSSPFHWNSLITMHFLDLLKEYQDSHKNSNFRKGNIWENMSALMKGLGHTICPNELSKKWKLLSTSYEKTIAYNKTHKDKKKCAFFKRLMDLHNHQTSFNCFNEKKQSVKRTVQVSPFSFSQGSSTISPNHSLPSVSSQKVMKEEKAKQTNTSDLITWLNSTWTEYKEIERKRQEYESQRHNEIMEMLSYLVEAKHH